MSLLTARLAALSSAPPAPGTSTTTTTSGESETARAAREESEARGRAISEGSEAAGDACAQDDVDLAVALKGDHEATFALGGLAAPACEEERPLPTASREAGVKAAFALNAPGAAVHEESDLLASVLEEEESVQAALYSETTRTAIADSSLSSDACSGASPHVVAASKRVSRRGSATLDSFRGSSRRGSVTTTVWSDGASGTASLATRPQDTHSSGEARSGPPCSSEDGDASARLPTPARLPKPTNLVATAAVSSVSDEKASALIATAAPLAMTEVAEAADSEVAEAAEHMEAVGETGATATQAPRALSHTTPPRSAHLLHNARIGAGTGCSLAAPDVRTGPLSNRHFDQFGGRVGRETPHQRLANSSSGAPGAGLYTLPSSGPPAQSSPSPEGDAQQQSLEAGEHTSRTQPQQQLDDLVQHV